METTTPKNKKLPQFMNFFIQVTSEKVQPYISEKTLAAFKRNSHSSEIVKSTVSKLSMMAFLLNPKIKHRLSHEKFFHSITAEEVPIKILTPEKISKDVKKKILQISKKLVKIHKDFNSKMFLLKIKLKKFDEDDIKMYRLKDLALICEKKKFKTLPNLNKYYIWMIRNKDTEEKNNTRSSYSFFKKIKNKESKKKTQTDWKTRSTLTGFNSSNENHSPSPKFLKKPKQISIINTSHSPSPKFRKSKPKIKISQVSNKAFKGRRNKKRRRVFGEKMEKKFSPLSPLQESVEFASTGNSFNNDSPADSKNCNFGKKKSQHVIVERSLKTGTERRRGSVFRIKSVSRSKSRLNSSMNQRRNSSVKHRRKSKFVFSGKEETEKKGLGAFARTVNKISLMKKTQDLFVENVMKDDEMEDDQAELRQLKGRIFDIENGTRSQDFFKISILKTKASTLQKRIKRRINTRMAHNTPVTVKGVKFGDISSYQKQAIFIENSKRYQKMTLEELQEVLK